MRLAIDQINQAADVIKDRVGPDLKIDTAIVLGTGYADLVKKFKIDISVPYSEIPYFPVPTVEGHPGVFHIATLGPKTIAILQGRSHLYEGLSVDQVLLPIAALHALGTQNLVLTNAAGGLDPAMKPGDLMIISDHINMTGVDPLVGPNDQRIGPRFMDASDLYDSQIRQKARTIAAEKGIPIKEGVYVGVIGPSYETPAEVRAFRNLGADAIGMSTIIEALYANYHSMGVFALSCISNVPLSGEQESLAHSSVQNIVSESLPEVAELLEGLLGRI